jgi:fumarate hydratase class I
VAFKYQDIFENGSEDLTEYRKLTSEGVTTVKGPDGREFLQVQKRPDC